MKTKIFLVPFAFVVAAALAFPFKEKKHLSVNKKKNLIRCSPDWNELKDWLNETDIPPLPGWGNYTWKIKTKSDSAQFYFNQGINMYYAFHIIEAMASFKKAEKFDPACAMIYWGQALAYGPNINDLGYAASPDALAASTKALALSNDAGPKEKMLIAAQMSRYAIDSLATRERLNQDYSNKMKLAYEKFPKDADVAALYADALMNQHPWDLWQHNGEARPWTPEIIRIIENTLSYSPDHPGANHYYIHAVEASPNPEKAMASADRLGKLMPAVAHLVHMPSHIYIRTGNYQQGTVVNEKAIDGYKQFLALYPDVVNNEALYDYHARHMQSSCAQMNGIYDYAIKTSMECRSSFDTSMMSLPTPLDAYIQYVYMTPVFTQIRFGKWEDILAAPAIPENYIYARVLQHFARGMAFARNKDVVSARDEYSQLISKINEPMMLARFGPFNTAKAGAEVAGSLLLGAIAEAEDNFPSAIQHYKDAVVFEDSMIYNEPKDWLLPPRHYLGNAELKAGKFSDAESTFKTDLKDHPNNGWALTGYYESLIKQGKNKEAEVVKAQLDKVIAGTNIPAKTSAF